MYTLIVSVDAETCTHPSNSLMGISLKGTGGREKKWSATSKNNEYTRRGGFYVKNANPDSKRHKKSQKPSKRAERTSGRAAPLAGVADGDHRPKPSALTTLQVM